MDEDNGEQAEQNNHQPILVAMGASAGGIRALQSFFAAIPEKTGAAFVVVVHLDPERRSELPNILRARTHMPVVQVENRREALSGPRLCDSAGQAAADRRPRNRSVAISTSRAGSAAPIDLFFRSVAERHGDGFAVILSGAGSDGALGVRAVKEAGGIILVQDPAEAEYPSMPRSAIASGIADFVLPVRELAAAAGRSHSRSSRRMPSRSFAKLDEELLRRVLAHLRVRTGHDFSKYKRSTVLRRIARRMQVTRSDDLQSYYDTLRDNAEEAQALFADLLISVTTFFRDPEAFETLRKDVLPQLFRRTSRASRSASGWPAARPARRPTRIAMLLLEEAARHDTAAADPGVRLRPRRARARPRARGPLSASPSRPTSARSGCAASSCARATTTACGRNCATSCCSRSTACCKDPPFSRVDLVSCRNVLIYLDRDLQQQVCSTFHYALQPGGYPVPRLVGDRGQSARPVPPRRPERAHLPVDRAARRQAALVAATRSARCACARARSPTRAAITPSAALNEAALHRQAGEDRAAEHAGRRGPIGSSICRRTPAASCCLPAAR